MTDPKSRARVQRLLNGQFRPDDLTGLFLYARDRCDGREPVAEIGHFVAHHHERNKGIITRVTREWITSVRYLLASYTPDGPRPLEAHRLPPAAPAYFRLASKRVGARLIFDNTGIPAKQAHAMLTNLADRLELNSDGTWSLPLNCSELEYSLLDCVSRHLIVRPAFDDIRLFDDFVATLKSNALITKEEIRLQSPKLKKLVSLYAVAAMHNCSIMVDGETVAILQAHADPDDRQIRVGVSEPSPGFPNVLINAAMFISNCDPRDSCHPSMPTNRCWDFDIELGPDSRLAPLR